MAVADVDLVVPSAGRTERLSGLLHCIGALDPQPATVVLVAGDPTTAAAARRWPVTVVEVTRRNAAVARNAGWRLGSAPLVAFLDDDCRPPAGWLAGAGPALADPGVVAAGGPVTNPDPGSLLARVAQTWLDRRLPAGDVAWMPSQNLVVRREALAAVGGFDGDLDAYEDVDLCRRLRASGGRVVSTGALAVAHEHRTRWRELARQHRGYGAGFVQMARKYPSWDQAHRAPLDRRRAATALALAVARPVRCALDMPRPVDRLLSLPAFGLREAAFLAGALGEARHRPPGGPQPVVVEAGR